MKEQTVKNILAFPVSGLALMLWIVMFKDYFGDNERFFEYLLNPSVVGISWCIGYSLPVNLSTYLAYWCWTETKDKTQIERVDS